MHLDNDELIISWFALLMEQKQLSVGSKTWFRYENLIQKIEKELGMKPRSVIKEIKNV